MQHHIEFVSTKFRLLILPQNGVNMYGHWGKKRHNLHSTKNYVDTYST